MLTDYKEVLYRVAVQNKAKTIVELGVGEGHSTVALLKAATKNGGHLYSVDVKQCRIAEQRVREASLDESRWTFLLWDDLALAARWHRPIDLLFVDTSHLYEHTLAELDAYGKFVSLGGVILLHDTLITPQNNVSEQWDVKRAVDDFVKLRREWRFKELLPDDNCGLGLLWRA